MNTTALGDDGQESLSDVWQATCIDRRRWGMVSLPDVVAAVVEQLRLGGGARTAQSWRTGSPRDSRMLLSKDGAEET